MAELLVRVARPDARGEAAIAFIAESLGFRLRVLRASDGDDAAQFVWGAPSPADSRAVVCPVQPADRISRELLDGVDAAAPTLARFDVVSAVAAFLDDTVTAELPDAAVDVHGRLMWKGSLAAREGYGDVPVVNRYFDAVGASLQDRFGLVGEPRWPEGKRAAVALSHDVDQPERYALLASALRPWRFRRHPRSYTLGAWRLARARLGDRDPDDAWAWHRVADEELRRGFTSSFFVAVTPFHHARGADRDVQYDARSPKYRAVLRELDAAGFDIGLHAGYRAYEQPAWMEDERARLADATGLPIEGVRHHFWQLGPDPAATLRSHEAAGFRHDSSLAFNEHIGFRRGVAIPFRPWDPAQGRPIRTLQIPTAVMDGNLFYESDDAEAGAAAVAGVVDQLVATGGVGSIDWHLQASVPCTDEYRVWGEAYLQILDGLAARPDVWVTSHTEIERWWTARAAKIGAA